MPVATAGPYNGWFSTGGMIRLLLALAIALPIAAQNPAVDVLH